MEENSKRVLKISYKAGFEIDGEFVKKIEHMSMSIYDANGQTFFEVKDENGMPTGKYVFYIIWRP